MLAILLLHANEVVRTERLIDELWGEQTPDTAAGVIYNHVSGLRKLLGPDVLLTVPGGYSLRAEPDSIDLHRFERFVDEARGAPAEERATKLREALALWRGEPLADLAAEPFARDGAGHLEDLRLAALEARIDADLELGRHGQVVHELEQLVREHPLREHFRTQLMLGLYRSGRQADALVAYREARRVLNEELGLEPSGELRELERRILSQDPTLDLPASTPAVRALPVLRARRRGVVLLAAAGLAIAAAAVATSIVHAGSHPRAGAAAAPSFSLAEAPAPWISNTRGSAEPIRSTKRGRTRSLSVVAKVPRSRRHRHGTRAAVRVPGSLAPALRPPPSSPPPRAAPPSAPPPPHPVRSPVAPKPTILLRDSFGGTALDRSLWSSFTTGSGTEVSERNGRLEMSIAADATPGGDYNLISGWVGSQCHFAGDFDARVSFELLQWPPASGVSVQLAAFFPTAGNASVERESGSREQYSAWIPPHATNIPSNDQKGRLRVTRRSGVVRGYFWTGGRWLLLERATIRGPGNLGLQVIAMPAQFGHVAVKVAYDDFVATGAGATGGSCPAA